MVNLIDSPPRTIMDVYKSLPEGTLAELIDGIIYMSPSPVYKHQSVLAKIYRQLCSEIVDKNLGEVIFAPFDVFLDEHSNAVQPDLVVILKENDKILDREGSVHGAPDLLVEIVSKSNVKHDTERKFTVYEKFGVKEYWIVDPQTNLAAVYSLVRGQYVKLSEVEGTISSALLAKTISF